MQGQEVRLCNNRNERELYDNMADLFAIIATTERLERAYIKDSIPASEYTPACLKLIAQFKTARNLLEKEVPDVLEFMKTYGLHCPAAKTRLLDSGVPATIEHGGTSDSSSAVNQAQHVAEAVQHFITAMDSLKLNMVATDQLRPCLEDLMDSLNKINTLPPDFDGRKNVLSWLQVLSKMRAHEELTEEQQRQMTFELDSAYASFYRFLQNKP
eukprot:GCRY01001025.1.p1 GENE.GCRY01001025.1~~GCRY01001025.1.p1  ORF type:complete len:213 (+),score=32.65 GCRY01001025.1:143-781(+)